MRSWPPGGATLISGAPFDQSTSASRLSSRRRSLGPRLGLAQCVGQALATEAIAECVRSGGVGEAKSNIELLGLVPTPAAANWDASVTVERINLWENTAKASQRKCEFDTRRTSRILHL